MNKSKLTAICHKISKEKGLPFNSVMTYYFLENILEKLATSNYSKNFVFKGGFLLSNVVGIDYRSTVDIDFLLKARKFSRENIYKIIKESLETGNSDIPDNNIIYKVQTMERIKEEDKYGGFRCKILCVLENIKQIVPLDIATGDIITPFPLDYEYLPIFKDKKIPIKAYPLETMLAEKIQTVYSRGLLNSRSKDYYDIYIIYKMKNKEINSEFLKEACVKTFEYRNTEFSTEKIINLLEKLKLNDMFLQRWESYSAKNFHAKEIKFEEVINNCIKIIELINNNSFDKNTGD